ncbi:MAG TPA: FtsX-like permease family protein, partial [Rhodothermales bacterium]
VTGVARSWPDQSHFSFDFLGSFTTLEAEQGSPSTNWNWWALSYYTYFRLAPGADVATVGEAVREMPSRYIGEQESRSGYRQFLYLQPIKDIHLTSHYRSELEANSRESYVLVFAAVALFILVIACVNFMNLSTARSAQRAREVGVRKVCGAVKRQLVGQFLGESVLISLLALAMALILIQAFLPLFNNLTFKDLSINYLDQWQLTAVLLAGTVIVGLLAGLYPAFVLSTFQTARVLKGSSTPGSHHAFFRQGLVVFQFTVSIMLIVGAIIAQRQLGYMRSADLGFDKEQTFVINARNSPVLTDQSDALKESLGSIPGVSAVTVSSSVPGRSMFTNVAARKSGMTEDGQTFYYLAVDYDFIDAYGLELIAGRAFSREMGSDDSLAWILNESAYKALGWQSADDPVGEEMTRQFGDTRTVVGVVRNFNYQSLQYAVEPIVLFIHPTWHNYASVRLTTDRLEETIAAVERTWTEFSPDRPMESFFLDQDFDRQYRGEERISGLLKVFTLIAILIACLGLFALASFVALQRRKEIGVRKVLGASTPGIVVMLSTSFARLVIVATALAIPLSWFAARSWLENFENRITLGWDVFVLAGILALAIALLTISYQSIRAAMVNPARTLQT